MTMTETDLLYTLALQHVPKIGDITAKKLIAHCGSAEAVFKEKKRNLLKIDGVGAILLEGLFEPVHLKEAEKEIAFIKEHKINVFYFEEANYPEKLKHCIDGPILLFQTGNINLKNQRVISIVGTRKITTIGMAFCEELIESLLPFNPVIVSGFAYGTDITAQKAALKHKLQTIGCFAHALNQVYPKVHTKYMTEVENNGGFFIDIWSNNKFDSNNIFKLKRVNDGFSEATIVVQ